MTSPQPPGGRRRGTWIARDGDEERDLADRPGARRGWFEDEVVLVGDATVDEMASGVCVAVAPPGTVSRVEDAAPDDRSPADDERSDER